MQCGFLQTDTPTLYSAIFLLHAPVPTLIKICYGALLTVFSIVSVKLTPLVTSLVFLKEKNVNIIYREKKKIFFCKYAPLLFKSSIIIGLR